MTDLRDDWALFSLRLSTAPTVCVLSDFDGTLAPLADDPDGVRLPDSGRRILEALSAIGRTVAGIVSGRSLADLAPRISVDGLWYVGNHGFEIRSPNGLETRFYEKSDVEYLNGVRDEFATETASIPGVLLEHKGPVVAVHYRRVGLPRIAEVERAFCRVMERHRTRLMMSHGDHVFEASLRGARNKGTAVRLIRRELPAGSLVVYFGDDISDRDVFRELRGTGISVEVGATEPALAHYSLPDPAAVWDVLTRMLEALGAKRPKSGRRGRPTSGT
jgi:trehalose-phosphatase